MVRLHLANASSDAVQDFLYSGMTYFIPSKSMSYRYSMAEEVGVEKNEKKLYKTIRYKIYILRNPLSIQTSTQCKSVGYVTFRFISPKVPTLILFAVFFTYGIFEDAKREGSARFQYWDSNYAHAKS